MKLDCILAKISDNADRDFQDIKGMNLLLIRMENKEDLLLLNPLKVEDLEKFYKLQYENELKELLFDDFDSCIEYLLDENCEFNYEINISNLDIIRIANENDLSKYRKNLELFKKRHGIL